jgi:hypothetical protein
MTRGDRFSGYKSDPYGRNGGSSFGQGNDYVAPSDDSDTSFISLFKRLLTVKWAVFGTEKDSAANSDDAEASLISLIKRLLGKIPLTNSRIDVNAEVEIPAIGEPDDAPASTDGGTASLIAINKRIAGKIPLTNNRIDVNAGVEVLGAIDDAPATTDTEDGTVVSYLKRISGKVPTVSALGNVDDAALTEGSASVISLLKGIISKMEEHCDNFTPISGTAELLTTADSQIIPAQSEDIFIKKIIISNNTATATLINLKTPTKNILTLLAPANININFDFETPIPAGAEEIIASNQTATNTFVNIIGYIDALALSENNESNNTATQLDWVADGDTNGVFYYRGTDNNTVAWSNPNDSGNILLTASTSNGNISALVDRANSTNNDFYTSNTANSWVQIDLKTYELVCSRYTVQNTDDYITQNWEFQASNDGLNWTTLDTVTNNPANAYAWVNRTIVDTNSWRYFRILMNGEDSRGSNYLSFSEIELYGELL